MNLSTADNVGLSVWMTQKVLQNASHFVRSLLNVFRTNLGSFTLLPLSLVSCFGTGEVSVRLVESVVVVGSPGGLLLLSYGQEP